MRPVRLTEIAFLDLLELAEQHGADALLFEVQRDAEHAVRELEHLAGHRVLDAVHARDAVADRDDAADFGDVDVDREAADLLADDLGNLFSFDVHSYSDALYQPFFHLLQLPRDAAVVDGAADARDDAADDRRIDFGRERDGPAGQRPRGSLLNRFASLRRERRRRRHFGAHDIPVIEQPFAVRGKQVGQQHEAIALGEQRSSFASIGVELRAARAARRPRRACAAPAPPDSAALSRAADAA